jgi:signal peptidase II
VSARAALARSAVVAALAIIADQIAKAAVQGSLERGEVVELFAGIQLVHVQNDGIAFGLLEGVSAGLLVGIGVVFTAGLGVLLVASPERPLLWLPIGLLAGGALGNLIDRLRQGSVTDFVDLPYWPAFNLADVEITIGVVLLLLLYFREPHDAENRAHSPEDEAADGAR